MAIEFARMEIVNRSGGGNACRKGAYNARGKVTDTSSNVTYNFANKGDNVYHEILLPEYVDQKFNSVSELMNEVERTEKRKNSQLLKDVVIALPDDKELDLQDRINITHRIIDKMEWVKEGLGVQIDIHKPHDGEKNWHAHLLITTRRFRKDGKGLGEKARDLNPEFKSNKDSRGFIIAEEKMLHEEVRDIINEYFKELGLPNRVDEIGIISQKHIGPMRMRSIVHNSAIYHNEIAWKANIELLKTGEDVIDRIIRNSSVFSRNDLIRAVKHIPDKVRAKELVEEALSSHRIVSLHDKDGISLGIYTIVEIRKEEQKLLRLGTYVFNQDNIMLKDSKDKISSLINADKELSKESNLEQKEALEHLLSGKGGIRIVRGRAGAGKSYTLGKFLSIASECDVKVVGLAPTHKAKQELVRIGYDKSDTIKGFLFKLYNDKVQLKKGSILVIDEAGMAGNDDYLELLRVAASYKCNVILSGDERQLGSISRGGMFEVYADKFGSRVIENIKRQDKEWGRAVAMFLSQGYVSKGIEVLAANNRLIHAGNQEETYNSLLLHWQESSYNLNERLIITIRNKDVDIINQLVRTLLKESGIVQGKEYAIRRASKAGSSSEYYMPGERIVFKDTDKKLGISNGEFGILTGVSQDEFTVRLDNGREVKFNPDEFSGFKHGYASTVFKAQGASIKDVYVVHNGFSTIRNSYVALSRHVKDIHLYANYRDTRNRNELIRQLGFEPEYKASINYLTKAELNVKEEDNTGSFFKKSMMKIHSFAKKQINEKIGEKITGIIDRNYVNEAYYRFKKPDVSIARVEEVLDQINPAISEYEQQEARSEEPIVLKAAVGENMPAADSSSKAVLSNGYKFSQSKEVTANETGVSTVSVAVSSDIKEVHTASKRMSAKMTAKERFYANRDYQLHKESKEEQSRQYQENYRREVERIRVRVKDYAEVIANEFFGSYNKVLSNRTTLRYGKSGKIAVRIKGEKAGNWYNFSEGRGGDLFSLIQEQKGGDFKEAVNYLSDRFGIGRTHNLRVVDNHYIDDKYADYQKQQNKEEAIEKAKARQVEKIYNRSKEIGNNSVAGKYLAEHRAVTCELSKDIRTTGIYDQKTGKYYPAIVAFARDNTRDKDGNITGGQQILLNSKTNGKANIAVAKRSFGKISGSFVEVSSGNGAAYISRKDQITIIAEGLETALSIKQAGIEARILCSLGVSNIKNYEPLVGGSEKIIIAADNDGIDAAGYKAVTEACKVLARHGVVRVVSPENIGNDFNDVLKNQGVKEIKSRFTPVIEAMHSNKLIEFLGDASSNLQLDEEILKKAKYIGKYPNADSKVLAGFKENHDQGVKILDRIFDKVLHNEKLLDHDNGIMRDIREFGSEISREELVSRLVNVEEWKSPGYLENMVQELLDQHVKNQALFFNNMKATVKTAEEMLGVVEQEQQYLSGLGKEHHGAVREYMHKDFDFYVAVSAIKENPELLDKVKEAHGYIKEHKILTDAKLKEVLLSDNNIKNIHTALDRHIENHYIQSNLKQLEDIKFQSKDIDELLNAHDKRQQFLISLDDNIKYQKDNELLTGMISKAKEEQKKNIISKLAYEIEGVLKNEALTKEQVIHELKTTADLGKSCNLISKANEQKYIEDNVKLIDDNKAEAKTVKEMLEVIAQEIKFFGGLYNNLKHIENATPKLSARMIGANMVNANIIDKLQKAADKALETGYMSEEELIKKLSYSSINPEYCYMDLNTGSGKHYIESNIKSIAHEKEKAKNTNEMLNVIVKESKFLSSLYNNISYRIDQSRTVVNSIEKAYEENKSGMIDKFSEIVKVSLEKGIRTDDELFKELKSAKDFESIYNGLKEDHKVHQIKDNLNKLDMFKKDAKEPLDVLKIIEKEQHYLSEWHNNIKLDQSHPDMTDRIKQADIMNKEHTISKLKDAVNHIIEHKIMDNDQLMKHLNHPDHISVEKHLRTECENHHIKFIKNNLKQLDKHDEIKVYGKVFDSKEDYLEHELNHPSHKFVNARAVNRVLDRVLEMEYTMHR